MCQELGNKADQILLPWAAYIPVDKHLYSTNYESGTTLVI